MDMPQGSAQQVAAAANERAARTAAAAREAAEEAEEALRRAKLAAEIAARAASDVEVAAAPAIDDDTEKLLATVQVAFNTVLDHLVEQARSVESINQDLNAALKIEGSDRPVIDFHLDRLMTPHEAFKALAETVVRTRRPLIDPMGRRKDVHFDDLLRWPDAPVRKGWQPETEFQLTCVEYARGKSIREFYERFLVRIVPDAVPERAAESVLLAFLEAFAVFVAPKVIVPYAQTPYGAAVFMRLSRTGRAQTWSLTEYQREQLEQALLALSTACTIEHDLHGASLLTSVGNELMDAIQRDHGKYKPGQVHESAAVLRCVLLRDKIEFHLGAGVERVFRNFLKKCGPSVEFVLIR